MRRLATLPLILLFAAPLLFSIALVVPDALKLQGLESLLGHPQFWGATWLTLFSGLASTALALVCSLLIIANPRYVAATRAGGFLAVPHLAFAIGFGFLIMPAGLLARIIAQVAGWTAPPGWTTTQDPHALALTVALVLKETPFLVWAFAAVLNRADLQAMFRGQRAVAASLGHSPRSVFLRLILPQLLPRVAWPLVAVLAYGLTVVDMALVIGPTQPPTLAQLIWVDINDADPASNTRGAAGVIVLSGLILLIAAMAMLASKMARGTRSIFLSTRPVQRISSARRNNYLSILQYVFTLTYGLVLAVLIVQSLAALWPFPNVLPQSFSFAMWFRLMESPAPVLTSLVLALATASLSVLAAVSWFESNSEKSDSVLLWLAAFALCLPALVIGLGQYRLFLLLGITGTAGAMFFAHVLPVAAYVFIMLQGPYRGFDERYRAASFGLRASKARFLLQVKWPMLKAALLSAFAVGFAVSIAQYVPAQLAAAGRYSTLPMEAVTLTSGGNRALVAVYGLVLMVMPLIVFLGAGRFGRLRWTGK